MNTMTEGLQEIVRALGQLEGTVSSMQVTINGLADTIKEQSTTISNLRVDGAVERTKVGFIGAAAGLAASALFKWVLKV